MKHSLKYMDIVDWSIEQITVGAVQPGKKFFSESMLGEIFGFSRQTVRHALEVLEQKGYITRIQGSGTYISGIHPKAVNQPMMDVSSSKLIGVISTHLDAYIFPLIIQGIEETLTLEGYNILLSSTKNYVEGEIRALKAMLDNKLEGLIVEPTKSGLPCVNVNLYKELINRGIPIVFLDSFYPELAVPYVALDDEEAGYVAVKHLLQMGHRDIIGIFTHSDRQGHLRYQGYIKALSEWNLPIRDDRVYWYSKENMMQVLYSNELWDSLMTCTAAFCYNDRLALMLIKLLRGKGKQVPEDYSVIGIDNSEMAQISSLSSVVHPAQELGTTAAKLLLSMINGEEGRNILFSPELILRDSVKKTHV